MAGFRALEEQLIQFMDYVPYIEQNHGVLSPKLVPILMDSCSLIDSVLRDSTSDGKRHTLRSYSKLHEVHFELEEATSLMLVSPMQLLRPFQGWTHRPPDWWRAHNEVKHDRIRNYPAATYASTVASVAGLHQVLARSRQFLPNLSRSGWFDESTDEFADLLVCQVSGCGPPEMPVESRLYVSPLRGTFVDWDTTPPTIDSWNFSYRVKTLIWQWEGW